LVAPEIAVVLGMLAAINFDDQPPLSANKVHDVRTDWFLADEF